MTVRNIRAHQSRGLLQPPVVRGRTGFYGPEHVARIELIKEMQADGFSLELNPPARRQRGRSSSEVLRFTRALREPFGDEEPQIIDAVELAQRWDRRTPRFCRRPRTSAFFRPLGDGRLRRSAPARAGR